MSGSALAVTQGDALWRVRLNRPQQGNALSAELVAEIERAMGRAEAAGVAALLFEGEGRHFCTGFDLSALDAETDDTLLARFVRIELMLQRVARAPFLTVAVAQGRAMGAGADLFAACGLRLVLGEASFAFPGARGFGLVLGTRRLAACVGRDRALQWVETAGTVTADDAREAGLVHAVLPTPVAVEEAIVTRLHADRGLVAALREAVEPAAEQADARDLERLVRSAARPGLKDRIAAYVGRNVRARRGAS